jgi:hypothetical protein
MIIWGDGDGHGHGYWHIGSVVGRGQALESIVRAPVAVPVLSTPTLKSYSKLKTLSYLKCMGVQGKAELIRETIARV